MAEMVGDRITPVAAECLLRDLDTRWRLSPLVFGDVEKVRDLPDMVGGETRIDEFRRRKIPLDKALQNGIEHLVRGERILVLLVGAKLR